MAELKLKALMVYQGISQAELARGIDLSAATVSQIVNRDLWPKTINRVDIEQRIFKYLQQQGITDMQLVGIFQREQQPVIARHINRNRARPMPSEHGLKPRFIEPSDSQELTPMLLRRQVLTQQARQHFGLFRDPFADPQSSEELFISPEIRYVRENLYQVTRYGVFLAIVGESGSGKSTMRKDLHARLATEAKPVIVIEPYVLGMEDNDKRGKTLKAADLCEAIMACVSPGSAVPQKSERRFRAIHEALRESHRMGNKHVLIIEEAHAIPVPTLKHLKRFYELEDGFEKLLSIVLIGQTELGQKLSEARADVREVVQRCEVVRLNPLGEQLTAYLKHRFNLVQKPLMDVMTEAAIEALRAKLTGHSPRGQGTYSVLYPLAVHNLVTAAMNMAASLGAPKLEADIFEEV